MQRYRTLIKSLFLLGMLGASSAILITSSLYLYLTPKLPSVDVLREAKMQIPLRIYSQNGDLIGEFGEKLRTPIAMSDVPPQFVDAILAAEDDGFLHHKGIDIGGLLRAVSELVISGEMRTGGSTITMQVARNFFLTREKTFIRKFNEIFLALQIERELTKQEILALYFNKIYLGKRAYGIQAAAGVYYGKDIKELTLAELAMIAGLPKAPSSYNPINNPERAIIRRNWILSRMLKLNYIDQQAFLTAHSSPITASYHGPKLALDAKYVAEMARSFAIDEFGPIAYTEGYTITTTIDSKLQLAAQSALRKGVSDYDLRHGYRGAEMSLDLDDDEAQKRFKRLPTIGGLIPALVVNIYDAEPATIDTPKEQASDTEPLPSHGVLELALTNGDTVHLPWQPDNNSLRPFINENRKGPKPKHISEVLKIGDVIRLKEIKNTSTNADSHAISAHYKISQLPRASAAMVALEPKNGAIRALMGGYDFKQSKFNRATQAFRQPGSNFKPFIYAAAMAQGYTAADIINDAPIVFADDAELETDWRPENASGKFYGPTTLRKALYTSRNIVSIKLLKAIGISSAIDYLDTLELGTRPYAKDLSLALGTYTMSPLEVAAGYAMLANGGYKVSPHLITDIRNRQGDIIFQANPPIVCVDCPKEALNNQADVSLPEGSANTLDPNQDSATFEEADNLEELIGQESATPQTPAPIYAQQLIDSRTTFILDNILKDVIQRGTGTKAKTLGRKDLAGKTGTTNGPTDAWFSGYHPDIVATTWLGFDDNQYLGKREYGGSAALPIWIDFMRTALQGKSNRHTSTPTGIVSVRINPETGQAARANERNGVFEYFREEYAPTISNNDATSNTDRSTFSEELF